MFQLEASETLSAGLRRLLLQQIDLARDQVGASGEPLHIRVHEARKAFKRSRALLRLVRQELGPKVYGDLNRTFRDAGRRLAPRRTAWVMRELAGRFRGEAEDRASIEAFARMEASLADGSERSQRLDDDGRLAAALNETRGRVDAWPTARDDFDFVRPGLQRVYRTGRRRMRAARRDPSCERFHEWRKVVKYLWHQVEVLASANPTILEPFADTVHSLADLLGDEHDLCDLLDAARRGDAFESAVELEIVERRLLVERSRLRSAAWPIADGVYREKPREFARRLAGYWTEWRVEAAAPPGIAGYGT